nr:DUF932 domain-containing protein [uncultured Pedobacter sp.]
MAHHINYNEQTQKHSFFSVKEKAWHGLGQIVSDYPTSAEALKFAGLDYEVSKLPNLHRLPNGKEFVSENSFFTYRTDTQEILGDKIGSDYKVVQNKEAFAFFDAIVNHENGILYETAGALGKGERLFITAKLPDFIRVGADDLIEKYLFLTTSHDGYGSITAAFTPIRICCQNTLNAALRNNNNCIKIRHTASARDRLKQAHHLLGITNQLATELGEVFNHWSKIKISDMDVKRLIQMAMAPSKEVLQNLRNGREDKLSTHYTNIVGGAMEYALTNPTQQEATTKGSLYGAYNAVTGYFQNVRNFKDDESKLKSILFGTGLHRSQTAFDLCTAFTKNGSSVLN